MSITNKKNEPSEQKTTCNHCGKPILITTAERTRGYCMQHRHFGCTFIERIGNSRIKLGRKVTMEFAGLEFLRTYALRKNITDADSRNRLAAFESAFQSGDEIRAFTGILSYASCEIYASRGFVLMRNGEVFEGVVIETKVNSMHTDGIAMLSGLERDDIEAAIREDQIPDFWG